MSLAAIERAAREAEGHYDPPWSLPALVHKVLMRRTAAWLARLPAGAWILDLGSASGALSRALRHSRPDLRVVSFDLSEGMTVLARRNGQDAVRGRGAAMPFPDQCFEAVVILDLLSNLEGSHELPGVMAEAMRVSRRWILAEIKVPRILALQLRIRRALLNLGARPLARFLFAAPRPEEPVAVYVHHPDKIFPRPPSGRNPRIRPWPVLPTPAEVHIVELPEASGKRASIA